jgi:sugar phosphate isomerase/epimerase
MEIGVSLSPTRSRFAPILFAGDLDEGLAAASRLGYDGIELSLLDSSRVDRASLIAKLRDLNLRVFTIATGQTYITDGCSLYHADAGKRQKAVDRVRGHIDFAAELKCAVIVGGIRGRIEASDGKTSAILAEKGRAAIASCVEHARRCGITVLLEPINRYESNAVNTLEEGLRMIEALGGKGVKLLPDTFHMNIEEASLAKSIAQAGSAVGYIHFADSNRLAPGWGHIDFGEVLAALQRIGYQGPVGIEVLPLPDDRASAEQAIRYVRMLAGRPKAAFQEGAS